jgi:hypothetical protein
MAGDWWSYEEDFITEYCNSSVDEQLLSPKTGGLMDRNMLDHNLTMQVAIKEAVEARLAELRLSLAEY